MVKPHLPSYAVIPLLPASTEIAASLPLLNSSAMQVGNDEAKQVALAGLISFGSADLISQACRAGETSSVAYIPQTVSFFRGTTGKDQTWRSVVPDTKRLDERLFEALAAVKVLTSKIAMHLEKEWRDRLFAQLDRMHSPAEWQEGDELLSAASFETFLKAWFQLKPQRSPGFGISVRGHLFASWVTQDAQLTLEFFPKNKVSWLVSLPAADGRERACGQTELGKLASRLLPYEPQRWFSDDQNTEH